MMMSTRESTATFNWTLSAYTMAAVAKLRDLAPYAVMELVLPGGSMMALLLWLYRRRKRGKGQVYADAMR